MQVLRAITNVTPAGSLQWFGPYKLLRAGSGFCQELVEDLWSYRLQEDAEFALGADAGLLAGDEPRLAGYLGPARTSSTPSERGTGCRFGPPPVAAR